VLNHIKNSKILRYNSLPIFWGMKVLQLVVFISQSSIVNENIPFDLLPS
jgi:hypothetical protein